MKPISDNTENALLDNRVLGVGRNVELHYAPKPDTVDENEEESQEREW